MAQGKIKVKNSIPSGVKCKKHTVATKNKGKMRKGQVRISSKKQGGDVRSMKRNLEKMIKEKVETETAGKVASTESRPLKYVK